jgi:hypothetical protein
MSIGSVRISVSPSISISGPVTCTWFGCTVTCRTRVPSAGSPVMSARTGSVRVPRVAQVSGTDRGAIPSTSTPAGSSNEFGSKV